MTIIDIGFDSNQDMHIDKGDISFTDENIALLQRLKIRLQFFYGEWFLNVTEGIPYVTDVFEKGSNIDDLYMLFRKEIQDTDGIETINSLDLILDSDNRGLLIEFSVNDNTVSGLVEVTI